MKITRRQLRRIIREAMLDGAPVTGTYWEQGYEDAVAGRPDRYDGAAAAGAMTNYEEYLKGYDEGLGPE